MTRLSSWTLQLLCYAGLFLRIRGANICFYPNGEQSRDVPCDTTAAVSMCCGSVAACLSNGLCKDTSTSNKTGNSFARGTCTDPQWKSPICPQQCQLNQDTAESPATAFDFRSNGVQVWNCNNSGFDNSAPYCCESAAEKTRCCQTQTAKFTLLAGTPGNAVAVQTLDRNSPTPTATSLTSTAARPTTTIRSVSSGSQTIRVSPGGASATSTTNTPGSNPYSTTINVTQASSSPISTSSTAQAASVPEVSKGPSDKEPPDGPGRDHKNDGNKNLTTGQVVGVGVGASIGSAIIVGTVLITFLRRREGRGDHNDQKKWLDRPTTMPTGLTWTDYAGRSPDLSGNGVGGWGGGHGDAMLMPPRPSVSPSIGSQRFKPRVEEQPTGLSRLDHEDLEGTPRRKEQSKIYELL